MTFIFGLGNRTVLRAFFHGFPHGKRVRYLRICFIDESPVKQDIKRFRTPRRFHPIPAAIGHDVLDLHAGCNSDPVVQVCLHRCAFNAPVGVREPADPAIDYPMFGVCCREVIYRFSGLYPCQRINRNHIGRRAVPVYHLDLIGGNDLAGRVPVIFFYFLESPAVAVDGCSEGDGRCCAV